jgi:(p)ppGpp synthase/HD superfamily hydrolase
VSADCYSPRLDDALAFAAAEFRGRRRKGTAIPYFSHLAQVMVTVAEWGGDEDQLIAALMHDWLEDIPGASEAALAQRYGARVARLVKALSDTTVIPKPPWLERKQAYLAHLASAPAEVKLISAADKLHNARSVRRDLELVGESVWSRFSATREQTLWYYAAVLEALATGWEHRLVDELRREVEELHRAAAEVPPGADWSPVGG